MSKQAKMASRSLVERVVAELIEIAKPNGYANQCEFARRFDVSEKTIQRDFDLIRDRLLLPIEYNHKLRRWELQSPEASKKIVGIGAVFSNITN